MYEMTIEDWEKLPALNSRTCPKCGNQHAAMRFGLSSIFKREGEVRVFNGLCREFIERRCLRCEFSWDEHTLDWEPKDKC